MRLSDNTTIRCYVILDILLEYQLMDEDMMIFFLNDASESIRHMHFILRYVTRQLFRHYRSDPFISILSIMVAVY